MWRFDIRILFVSALLIQISWTFVEYSDIEIEIVENQGPKFEDKVKEKMNAAIENIFLENVINIATYIPVVGKIIQPLTEIIDVYQTDSRHDMFIKAISEETERAILLNDYQDIRRKLLGVQQHMRVISKVVKKMINAKTKNNNKQKKKIRKLKNRSPVKVNNSTTIELLSATQIIVNNINEINNKFFVRDSKFRHHPQFAFLPLTILTPALASVKPLFDTYSPTISKIDPLPCRVLDNLLEYRFLLIWSKFKSLIIDGRMPYAVDETCLSSKRGMIAKTLLKEYNIHGYNPTNADGIKCYSQDCDVSNGFFLCLTDSSKSQQFMIYENSPGKKYSRDCYMVDAENCITGYTDYLRSFIESEFQPHIDISKKMCTRQMRKPRTYEGNF